MSEKRHTPSQYLNDLVKFHESQPEVKTKKGFEDHLSKTIVKRYKEGTDQLDEIKELLKELANEDSLSSRKEEISAAVEKVDKGIVKLAYGALRYNKAVETKNVQLWPGNGPFVIEED